MRASGPILLLGLFLTAVLASALALTAVPAIGDDSDMYEIGTMAQDDYGEQFDPNKCCCLLNNEKGGKKTYYDATWSGFANRFVSRMHELSAGYHEISPFPIRDDTPAHASQISCEAQGGQNLGDRADVFVWTGHTYISILNPTSPPGGPGGSSDRDNGAALHFIADHTGNPRNPPPICCYNKDSANINHKEIRLGADDTEVAVFLCCEWLRNCNYQPLYNQIHYMMHGMHIMCSFATSSYFAIADPAHEETYGQKFAENVMGIPPSQEPKKVIPSWHEASEWAQGPLIPPDADEQYVVARCMYWNGDCYNDYMVGNWRGYSMGGPPPWCTQDTLWQFADTSYYIYPSP